VATGRVLVVHPSGATRALLTEVLSAERLRVEAVGSSIACIARFVDEPADLVILGLGRIQESELELIKTLKAEAEPPRILVCFPSPKRDLAVRALTAGADGYLLEPFYAAEALAIVNAQLAKPAAAPAAALGEFAHEVAHAINNPLQVIMLLLGKEKVTKKELMDHIPDNVERIHRAVEVLKTYAAMPTPMPTPGDARDAAERIAREKGVLFTADPQLPDAMIDERAWAAALDALFDAVRPTAAKLTEADDAVVLTLEGGTGDVPDTVLWVTPEREVRAGLLMAHTLIERLGGTLKTEGATLVVRLRRG